jgi:release factor glutamine methyltransferase
MTLLEVLRSTTDYFAKRNVENPRLNAELLLAHALGRKRIELYLGFEDALGPSELDPLRELVRRRGQGEPLQHLVGTVEFLGREFLCDKRALVPRPETEELVEFLQSAIRNPQSAILDVGTGNGVIAISLALAFPGAEVIAVDVSDDAIALAKENSARFGLGDRIQFVKGDLLTGLASKFDTIVANLPYVARQERGTLSREVLWDPEVALFGGDKGDELVRALIDQAPGSLSPNGLLALEIGLGQAEGLRTALEAKNYHDIEAKNDYSGITRFLLAWYG